MGKREQVGLGVTLGLCQHIPLQYFSTSMSRIDRMAERLTTVVLNEPEFGELDGRAHRDTVEGPRPRHQLATQCRCDGVLPSD